MSNPSVHRALGTHASTQTHPAPHHTSPAENVGNLILPDGLIGQETAELLQDLFHSNQAAEGASSHQIRESVVPFPPKRKSNARRLLMLLPLLSIPFAVTLAPRIEIYNLLACSVHRPEIFDSNFGGPERSAFQSAMSIATTQNHQAHFLPEISLERRAAFDVKFTTSSMPQQNRCASDPVVRTAVAKLTAVISATSGILMCLTTGWWGSFSDRHGRKLVIILATCSMLVTDFNFILATWFLNHIPGGYWFLLIGAVADGLFGGITVATITNQSYIADSTAESDRSAAFSLALGLIYSGIALGPTLGSLFIHFTGRILSVFYLSAVLHVLHAICVLVIVPESLSLDQMKESRVRYSQSAAADVNAISRDGQTLSAYLLIKTRALLAFLTPLAVFLPVRDISNLNPGKRSRRDWSMTTMIVGYAFMISVGGSYSYKFQYATSTFNWSSETLGYWLSLIGASRAIHLAIILPLILKIFKPKPILPESKQPNAGPYAETTPSSEAPNESLSDSLSPLLPKKIQSKAHSSSFDLRVAKYSLIVDLIAFAAMGLTNHSLAFAVFGILGSFSVGFSPAAEAVILALYLRRGDVETGKLFGAVGLVQAICLQVAGPTLFGLVYMKTVGTYPRTIFLCSITAVIVSFILISIVRLPKENGNVRETPGDAEEQDMDP